MSVVWVLSAVFPLLFLLDCERNPGWGITIAAIQLRLWLMVLLVGRVDAFVFMRLGPEPNSAWSKQKKKSQLKGHASPYNSPTEQVRI